MAFIIKDRVKESTTTTGTGAISLGGSVATFDAFSAYMNNGDTAYYAIVHTTSGVDEWEVGLGTWNTGNTLTRTTVLSGSNGTSAETFSSGPKDVFMTYPAAVAAYTDGSGDLSGDMGLGNHSTTELVEGSNLYYTDARVDARLSGGTGVTYNAGVISIGQSVATTADATFNTVTVAGDPTSGLHLATKEYVDTIASAGIHYHDPVRAEHPTNLAAAYNNGSSGVGATLTNSGTNAAIVLDGVSLDLNDRVLVSNQTNQTQNGVYSVTTVGSGSAAWVLTRTTDTDSYSPSDPDSFGKGDAFFIKEGAVNAGHLDVLTTAGVITFGTTNIHFAEVAETTVYSAGTGLDLTGTTFATKQDISTTSSPTFNTVTANLTGNVDGNVDGNVTGNVTGDVTGNADTATTLETARNIQLTGDVTGTASFNGSSNAVITAVVQDDSHNHVISNVDGLQTSLDSKTPTSRTLTAGNGLTGGGTLAANRTFTVGAGTGVTVNADDVAIGQDVATSADVVFSTVGAGVINATGGSFSSSTDTKSNAGFVLDAGNELVGNNGTYLRTLLKWDTSSNIEIGQVGTSLITGINLLPGSSGLAKVNGVEIITTAGSGLTKSGDTLSHTDTSSQASVNNSNGTVIQDITLDTFGHITGIASTNLDGRYYTETEADSRFVNVTGDTITSGTSTGLTINHNTFANGLVLARNDTTNSAAIKFKNNAGETGILYADTGTKRPIWRPGGTANNFTMFTEDYHPNADKWTTARTLSLSGDATGSVSWDGSANATLSVTVANDSHNHDGRYYTETEADSRFVNVTGDTMTGNLTVDAGTSTTLSVKGDDGGLAMVRANGDNQGTGAIEVGQSNAYGGGISYNGDNSPAFVSGEAADAITFYRLSNGTRTEVFSYPHNGNRVTFNEVPYVGSNSVFHDGYHPNSDRWTTARTLSLSGQASGSVSWDGSANATLSVTLSDSALDDQYVTVGSRYSGNGDALIVPNKASIRIWDVSTASDAPSGSTDGLALSAGWDSGSWGVQQYHDFHSNDLYLRAKNNGAMTSWDRVFHDTYHPNADKWTTARTLSLTGDVTGSVSWDGSGNASITTVVGNDSHTHDTRYMQSITQSLTTNINTIASKSAVVRWNNTTTGRPASSQSNEYGPLLQMAYEGTVVSQLAHDFDQDNLYFRKLTTSSDTGTSWKRLFHDSYHPNADKWTTARTHTVTLTGDVTGTATQSVDGTGNKTWSLSTAVANDSHTHSIYVPKAGGTMTGNLSINNAAPSIHLNDSNDTTIDVSLVNDGESFYIVETEDGGGIQAPTGGRQWLKMGDDTSGVIDILLANGAGTNKVFHQGYHPNADKWTTARTLSLTGDASGSVSWDGSGNASLSVAVADNSHSHNNYTPIDHFRHTGHGNYTSTTTSALLTEALSDDAFDSKLTAHKTGWNYAGNGDLTDAGRLTELAGTSWLWWTDNSNDNVQGNVTALAIAPSSGGSAGKAFIYNNQGSGYSPGWREIWTSTSDGAGSGLDADLLDGVQGSSYLRSDGNDETTGALTISGSTTSGGANTASQYHSGADNLILKGNSVGISSIFFQSEKDGTNINHTSDFGFLQFHSYGTATSGEANELILGVSNDADDCVIVNTPSATGFKFRTGASATDYTVWHAGNDGDGSGLDADLLDGHHQGSFMRRSANSQLDMNNNDIVGVNNIFHEGDSNTYMGFHNADQWRVVTGGTERLEVNNDTMTVAATLSMAGHVIDMNNNDIIGVDQIIHEGDTNTYIQFHAADQWRVVTGGAERLEVNNSQITSTEPVHAPSFHGDGSNLTGIATGANNDIFWENGQTVTSNYTITNGKNAMSAGPITINSGVTVTVGAGETWTVV